MAAMEREQLIPDLDRINWPDHVTSEQLTRMVKLCSVKNTRVVVADEIEAEGLVIRGAVEQKFRTEEHPQWQMAHGHASIGQYVRQVDDSLGIWCRERGRENFTPVNTVKQRHLYSLIHDPRGLELLEMLVLEKSSDPEVSLPKAVGLTAGARRYCQLYGVLIEAGVKPKELEERFYPPIAGGAEPLMHRRKDIPKEGTYTIVEEIIKDGVLVDELGDYHVLWDKSHSYFQDIHGVLRQHERVIEKYQGILISVGDRVLEIEGEIPQVARFASRLSMISAGFRSDSFQTPQTRRKLLGELGALKDEIGQVRNELKKQGKDKIVIALSTTKPKVAGEKTQEAAGDFLARASDAADKLEGVLKRKEKVEQKRAEWEGKIGNSLGVLAAYLLKLEEGKSLTHGFSRSIIQQINESPKNILADLQSITGQPYKRRMEHSAIRNLSQIPEAVRRGDLLRTKKILEEAISKLNAVVEEKAVRERAAKSSFAPNSTPSN